MGILRVELRLDCRVLARGRKIIAQSSCRDSRFVVHGEADFQEKKLLHTATMRSIKSGTNILSDKYIEREKLSRDNKYSFIMGVNNILSWLKLFKWNKCIRAFVGRFRFFLGLKKMYILLFVSICFNFGLELNFAD